MRILFVASRLPYPPLQGDRARAYHQIRCLARRHHVTLIAPARVGESKESAAVLQPLCERILLVPFSRAQGFMGLPKGFFSRLPFQTFFFCVPEIRRTVAAVLAEKRYDLIHVQLVRMAPAAVGLPGVPKVLDLIDALSLNWFRRAEREARPVAPFVRWEARRIRQYERTLIGQYDHVTVCSSIDRAAIGSYENLHVVSNGVGLGDFPFSREDREPATIVFTGRMGYFPNADAADWFARQAFPAIRRQLPEARFVIVGADVSPRIRALEGLAGVQVTGRVPSVHSYLARATVAVCPMRTGSGMQFKVLEAMASGTPVVATPYALGGIDATHEEHLLIAKDPESFGGQVVRLLKDGALQRRLAYNARQLVEENYTWEQSVAMLEGVYRLALLSKTVTDRLDPPSVFESFLPDHASHFAAQRRRPEGSTGPSPPPPAVR